MADLGYKVIEYDGSIEHSPYNHKNIIFHKKFISTQNNENEITLEAVIKSNKLNPNLHNILQCDIENAEWDVLENFKISDLARVFSQVIFEFHGLNPEESSGATKRQAILARLNEHFYPIHAHFNNHGKIFYCDGKFFSTTLEVSFVRKNLIKGKIKYRKNGLLKRLDSPSEIANPEIPLIF